MGEITTVGIDLVKNVFSLHGVDAHGKTDRAAQDRQPLRVARTHGATAAVPDRHGSLLGSAPVGPRPAAPWLTRGACAPRLVIAHDVEVTG